MILQKSYIDINNSFAVCGNFVYRETGSLALFSHYLFHDNYVRNQLSCRWKSGFSRGPIICPSSSNNLYLRDSTEKEEGAGS